jgi:hypothetical protein
MIADVRSRFHHICHEHLSLTEHFRTFWAFPGAGGAIGAGESRKLRRMAIPWATPALWQ